MKTLTFYRLSLLSTILFTVLAFILMFAPNIMLSTWGVELSDSTGLLARRIAALYTGIAVMYFLARNMYHSTIRTALIFGTIIACALLALLGIYDFISNYASQGILISVLIEITLALAFLYVHVNKK